MPLLNLGPGDTAPARDSFSPGGPLFPRGRKFAALFSFLPQRAAYSDFRARVGAGAFGSQGRIRRTCAAAPVRCRIFVLCSLQARRGGLFFIEGRNKKSYYAERGRLIAGAQRAERGRVICDTITPFGAT